MTDFDDTVITPARAIAGRVTEGTRADAVDDTIIGVPVLPSANREIAAPVSAASATVATVHYRFRIGENSEPVTLDAPAYIGRSPSSPRIVSGVIPRLLRVASPLQEVSSTHIELRQLGTSIIVTDLKSTNGSLVMMPGSAPRKLRQGESLVVSPGTLVDIGDGNIIEILPMQRANVN